MTKDILKQFISENADYFICGPVPFMKAVINYLKELGVASENIHYEFFGPALQIAQPEGSTI
jgi:nitric oxide dioxygenase